MTPRRRALIGAAAPFDLLQAAGTQVAVARRGSGRLLLCLHATGHGASDFAHFADVVTQFGFETVSLDWPGHGRSPADATGSPVSAARYGAIAADVLQQVSGGRTAIVIGSSIGGMAALQIAHDLPQCVRALVLCNPGGLAPVDRAARYASAGMSRLMAAGERGAWWFPAAFALYYRLVLPGQAVAGQRRKIVSAAPETAGLIKQAWQSFAKPDADMRDLLAGLDLPILFAWAMSDRIVAWGRSRAAVDAYAHGVVKPFRGGHIAFLEDPEAFIEAFRDFASALDERPSM